MKKDFTNFEKGLKNSLESYEVPFDSSHWQEMEMKLEGRSASNLNTLAAAVVTALIFISGITYVIVADPLDSQTAQTANEDSQFNSETKSETTFDSTNKAESVISEKDFNDSNNREDTDTEGNSPTTVYKVDTSSETNNKTSTTSHSQSSTNKELKNNELTEELETETESNESVDQDLTTGNDPIVDASPFISVNAREVCAGEQIMFKAENITDESKFLWNFGNADFSTEVAPVRTFEKAGEYNVTLILSKSTEKILSKIVVLPKPSADFNWSEENQGEILFNNKSVKADISEWEVNGKFLSKDINPSFSYSKAGKTLVHLRVENEFGCSDSTYKYVNLRAPVELTAASIVKQKENFIPQVSNPEFGTQTLFSLHNMQGQLIYESEAKEAWNGTLPDGTYPASNTEFAWLYVIKDSTGTELFSDSGKIKIIP